MNDLPQPALVDRFVDLVGERYALRDGADQTHYTHENRDIVRGRTPVVLKPGSAKEVSRILELASETRTPIVPQGGHTGHVGAGVPSPDGDQIVVSLERMKRIVDIDARGNTATVEAGDRVQFRLQVADGSGPGDLIEAGIDDVSICPR